MKTDITKMTDKEFKAFEKTDLWFPTFIKNQKEKKNKLNASQAYFQLTGNILPKKV